MFYHFPKILDRSTTFYSVTLKNTQTEFQKIFFFQRNKKYLESEDKIKKIKKLNFIFFSCFLENYSRRVRKSTNKKVLALSHLNRGHILYKKQQRNILISFSCIRECGIQDSKVFVMLLSIMNIYLRGNTTF